MKWDFAFFWENGVGINREVSQHQSWHNWDHANAEKCDGVRGIGTMFYGKCAFQYESNAFTILPYATVQIKWNHCEFWGVLTCIVKIVSSELLSFNDFYILLTNSSNN